MHPGKAILGSALATALWCCTLQTGAGEGCPRDCASARAVCADACDDDELCIQECDVEQNICLEECSSQ